MDKVYYIYSNSHGVSGVAEITVSGETKLYYKVGDVKNIIGFVYTSGRVEKRMCFDYMVDVIDKFMELTNMRIESLEKSIDEIHQFQSDFLDVSNNE